MTPTCRKAIRSLRSCERLNLIQALQATLCDRDRIAIYHRQVAASSRRDARLLQLTAR